MRAVFLILAFAMSLYIFWLGYVVLLSRRLPEKELTNKENRTIAVMVCARNEEKVIGPLLESLKKQNYPADCYKVFVIAHNCTDQTVETVQAMNEEVIICNNSSSLKSSALKYGLDQVCEKYNHYYQYYAVFDADGLAHPDFLKEINKGLDKETDVVSGYYASKNFSDNLISKLSGTLYHSLMHLTCLAHNRAGLPVNIYGTGYVAKMELKEQLNQVSSLVDDFELSILWVMNHKKMRMAPKALFYAEMPVQLKEALKQRRRWAYGDKQCFMKYHGQLLKSLKNLGLNGFKQYMDLLMFPVSVVTFFCLLLGLFTYGVSFMWILLFVSLIFYFFFLGTTICALEKRGIPFRENIRTCLLEPFWILLTPLMCIDVLFYRHWDWQPTERNSFISIDEVK